MVAHQGQESPNFSYQRCTYLAFRRSIMPFHCTDYPDPHASAQEPSSHQLLRSDAELRHQTQACILFAWQGEVVVMAGAGVSAGGPSALPSWWPLNAAIVEALCYRLESGLERPDWLGKVVSGIDVERCAGRFPPEYQAQLIEEMRGERYFRALQALDIDRWGWPDSSLHLSPLRSPAFSNEWPGRRSGSR